jgi:HK97 family phage prohead protease
MTATNGNVFDREAAFTLERTDPEGDGRTLEGYAAVFNSPADIEDMLGTYTEVIKPGAFKRTLEHRPSPPLLFNHGRHPLIGNMPIGAIQEIREDDRGLYFRARMFDNWLIEPLSEAIREDAVKGMSFRFEVPKGAESWNRNGAKHVRSVREVVLHELGPVVFPAYSDATATLRSLSEDLEYDETRAVWSTAFVNNLPDSSFAYIEGGGSKDSDGKTTPRSLRHFPIKDSAGNCDAAHVRNALSRAPQSPFGSKAMGKISACARSLNIGAPAGDGGGRSVCSECGQERQGNEPASENEIDPNPGPFLSQDSNGDGICDHCGEPNDDHKGVLGGGGNNGGRSQDLGTSDDPAHERTSDDRAPSGSPEGDALHLSPRERYLQLVELGIK